MNHRRILKKARKMSKKLIYRPLKTSDMRFLAEYGAQCGGMSKESEITKIERRLRRRFKDPNHIGIIALQGKVRLGFVDGIIAKDTLEINEIYVNDRYRSMGIGRGLLEAIISVAKSRGMRIITFQTEADNYAMQDLGKKVGFVLKVLTYEKILVDSKRRRP